MKIYHNPRCRKSREALNILHTHGLEPEVVLYLEIPPTEHEINDIADKLGVKPFEMIRKEEKLYKEEFKGKELADKEWVRVMADNPKLIQRPIVVNGDRAVIARPPESLDVFLD